MTSRETARTRQGPGDRKASPRLTGIDAARGLALLGMMATHLLPTFGSAPDYAPTGVGLVFSGRSAALFALLAGIGLALSTGKQQPFQGTRLRASRRGIALRALVIGTVGLLLGGLDVNVAVILVHYAALFLCILPFLGLRPAALGAWAAGWVLLSPVLAYQVRPWLMAAAPALRLGHNPNMEDFGTPGMLLADLFFTGYYPVVQWMSYLLIGLLLGRLALGKATVQAALAIAGTAMGTGAWLLGRFAMEQGGGRAALEQLPDRTPLPLESMLQVNLTGVEQSGSWWWLASSAPHSGTTLDLLHTAGTAAAVVGVFLLLARLGEWLGLNILLPLSGPGAMTLSLYSVHVWVLSALYRQPLPSGWTVDGMYWAQALAAVAVGVLFALLRRRGPLEWLSHQASRLGSYRPAAVG